MIADLFGFLRTPTLRQKKEKDLEEAHRTLHEANLLGEWADAQATMAQCRIERLTEELTDQPIDMKEANVLIQRVS